MRLNFLPSWACIALSWFATTGCAHARQVWEKPIAPGVVYRMEVDLKAPRIVHSLRFNLRAPNLRFEPELAGGTIEEEGTVNGRLAPSVVAKAVGAIAAINGDYFSYDRGSPIGLMVRNGELLTSPIRPRAVLAWGPQGAKVGLGTFQGSVIAPLGFELKLDQVNQPCGKDQAVLYTPAQGILRPPSDGVLLTIDAPGILWAPSTAANVVIRATGQPNGPITVHKGEVLLLARGSKARRLAELGIDEKLKIKLQTNGFDWERFENVISGGPVLLRGGQPVIDAEAEGFAPSFYAKRHPRTAIGITANGEIVWVTVDGRNKASIGATLEELTDILKRLGCRDAINLDGGGSTDLTLLGADLARPGEAAERPVANVLALFAPRDEPSDRGLKLVVPKKIRVTDQLDLQLFDGSARLPDVEIIWAAQGSAWIDQGGRLHPDQTGTCTISASAHGLTVSITVKIDS